MKIAIDIIQEFINAVAPIIGIECLQILKSVLKRLKTEYSKKNKKGDNKNEEK